MQYIGAYGAEQQFVFVTIGIRKVSCIHSEHFFLTLIGIFI